MLEFLLDCFRAGVLSTFLPLVFFQVDDILHKKPRQMDKMEDLQIDGKIDK